MNWILHKKQTIAFLCAMLLLFTGISCRLAIQDNVSVRAADTEAVPANPRIDAEDGVVTWDCVYFGNYWQNDTNRDKAADRDDEKEPIKWRVLSVDGEDAFLLAEYNLDCQPYHTSNTSVTWENCTLRSWLNGYEDSSNASGIDYSTDSFIHAAFSEEEQSAIWDTDVANDDNADFGTEGGDNTTDKVFLLSITEAFAESYGLHDYHFRVACSTAYAATQGVHMDSSGSGDWFLRSPGNLSHSVAYVTDDGYIFGSGCRVDNDNCAVRPALHLNLAASGVWSYAGTVSTGAGETEEPTVSEEPVTTEKPKASDEPDITQTPSAPAETATTQPVHVTPEPLPVATKSPTVSKEEKDKNAIQINRKISLGWTENTLTVKWNKLKNAEGYDIYAAVCGTDFDMVTMSVKGQNKSTAKITKVNGEFVSKSDTYKVKVCAYRFVDGKKQYIGTSAGMHVVGSRNKKITNAKNIKLAKKSYTIKKGNAAMLKASIKKQDKKKKLLSKKHGAQLRYTSSDKNIATVTKAGKIKAKSSGSCIIYVMALNGISKKVKVTVIE